MFRIVAYCLLILLAIDENSSGAEPEKTVSAIEALKPFNSLVGKWNAAGVPDGTTAEKQQGHWTETLDWSWRFKAEDAWLAVTFKKGKYFASGELRHLPKENVYQFKVETVDKQKYVFLGIFKEHELRLERIDDKTKETQRLIFALLHRNRINYRYETKLSDKTFWTKVYRVGATKDGEPLVEVGVDEKECIVSGGRGTSTVTFMGKTYYVCCSGCRDAFDDDPAKFVKAFDKKRAKQK